MHLVVWQARMGEVFHRKWCLVHTGQVMVDAGPSDLLWALDPLENVHTWMDYRVTAPFPPASDPCVSETAGWWIWFTPSTLLCPRKDRIWLSVGRIKGMCILLQENTGGEQPRWMLSFDISESKAKKGIDFIVIPIQFLGKENHFVVTVFLCLQIWRRIFRMCMQAFWSVLIHECAANGYVDCDKNLPWSI